MSGRAGVVGVSEGGALTAGAGPGVRLWRVPALVPVAVLACTAALALATLPSATAPVTHPRALMRGLRGHSATRLPVSLAATASASMGASERSFWPVLLGASVSTRGGGIRGTFTASGVVLRASHGTLGLYLSGVGRGKRVERLPAVLPSVAAGQVLYRHGSVVEFYRNGPYGLEQGFTVSQRARAGAGPLVLSLGLQGSLVPNEVGSQVLFRTHAGAIVFSYGQLGALDATGRGLPARLQIDHGTLQMRIDDRKARYPLRIDPFIQQGEELTEGEVEFGKSVALSQDGNTALIGGPQFENHADPGNGAAWVFTRSGSIWTQQALLTANGESIEGRFGERVALSADGNTALIVGQTESTRGAVWAFKRSGSTWTQPGAKLTGSSRADFEGGVALSGDGNTALVGGRRGAIWVLTRSASSWLQGPELDASRATSFALSYDGDTALVGDGRVFTRSGSSWAEQTKLPISGNVALSSDGNTALIGGVPGDFNYVGAAFLFTRSGSSWAQRGEKLTGSGEIGEAGFGSSVALSANGNTALIGGPGDNPSTGAGAVWVFRHLRARGHRSIEKLTTVNDEFGRGNEFGGSVALSAKGDTALIGSATFIGGAWVFVRRGHHNNAR